MARGILLIMEIIQTDILTGYQKIAVLKLWNQEYPAQLKCKTMTDFEQYLFTLTDASHFLLLDEPVKSEVGHLNLPATMPFGL